MMMPANYSVIAENEMTYVVGGGVIEAIGAVTAPIWTAANLQHQHCYPGGQRFC